VGTGDGGSSTGKLTTRDSADFATIFEGMGVDALGSQNDKTYEEVISVHAWVVASARRSLTRRVYGWS
jgi:hypothetical protein